MLPRSSSDFATVRFLTLCIIEKLSFVRDYISQKTHCVNVLQKNIKNINGELATVHDCFCNV